MSRHAPPAIVIEWRKEKPAPRCCHTCENYTQDGMCQQHQESPPAEFAASLNQCQDWLMEIPF